MKILRDKKYLLLSALLALGLSLSFLGIYRYYNPVTPAMPVAAPQPLTPIPTSPAPNPTPTITPDPAISVVPEATVEPAPVASKPVASKPASAEVSLKIPAIDLTLPVHALTPAGGAIDPPTMTDAYWIKPYGDPAVGDNTVYIAAHSWRRGDAAFNALLNKDRTGSTLKNGDRVTVTSSAGDKIYEVNNIKRYGRNELPDSAEVWEVKPGRLVIITCFQREDGKRSTENLVITTQQVA